MIIINLKKIKKIHQKESDNIITKTNKNDDRDDICPINMVFRVEKNRAKEENFGFNLFSLEEKDTIKEKMIIDNNNNFIDFNKINNIKEEKNCNDKKDENDSATKNVFPDKQKKNLEQNKSLFNYINFFYFYYS